jgi:hypothetical protein
VAALGRVVEIDHKWLNGREPVAVAAADHPELERAPVGEQGPARSPAIDRVLGLAPEPVVEETSAAKLSAGKASAIGPVAAPVSHAGPRLGPTSGAVGVSAADPASAAVRVSQIGLADRSWAADRVSAAGQGSVTDLASVAGQELAVGRESAAGQASVTDQGSAAGRGSATDRESAAGRVLVADLGSATDRVLQTGRESVIDPASAQGPASPTAGAGQVYPPSLQGLPGLLWEAAFPIALATVPLPTCQDWVTTGWAPASSPPIRLGIDGTR